MDTNQSKTYWIAAGAVLLATVAAYWPSFSVPFYLDDFVHLVASDRLHDATDLASIWNAHQWRFLSMWTLAANYSIHGESVFGYHLVNLIIHLLAGFALWLLLTALLRSPNVDTASHRWLHWLPLIAVAIFLLHPLQTQAVTYIIQRHASLMAMFYLLSMAAYSWGRVRGDWRLFLIAALAALMALLSKQSAATLPLAVLLIEFLFFRNLGQKTVAGIAGGTTLLAILVTWMLHWPAFDLTGLTRESSEISRLDYLATQLGVLWHYVRLFFLIGEQRLEYGIPLTTMAWRLEVMLPLLGHLAMLSLGLLAWRRAPLIAFGILFYYIAHLVESSVIPIRDLAFEHRTYLPNVGLVILVGTVLTSTLHRPAKTVRIAAILSGIFALGSISIQTMQRNQLWSDQARFLYVDASREPLSLRALSNLGGYLNHHNQFEEALVQFKSATELLEIRGESLSNHPTILIGKMVAFHNLGKYPEMFSAARELDVEMLSDDLRFTLHNLLGRTFFLNKNFPHARAHLEEAVSRRAEVDLVAMLAQSELAIGRRGVAWELASSVLQVDPDHPRANAIMDNLTQ